VTVYRDGNAIYVLSVNRGLGYAGLAVYDLSSVRHEYEDRSDAPYAYYLALNPDGDVFLQTDWEIRDILGARGVDQSPASIVRKLIPYLPN
jgi:hypothetical protein